MAEERVTNPIPRLSATMMVVREANGPHGFEVMAIKRSQNLRVLPGFMVFPGGVLDQMDVFSAKSLQNGQVRTPHLFAIEEAEFKGEVLPQNVLYLSLVAAGARELLEEAGIYMANSRQGEHLAKIRASLLQGQGSEWIELITKESSWYPLHYVGRRVTPQQVKHRFDTHFFIVQVPRDTEATPSPDEVETVFWSSPEALLDGFQKDEFHMAPPTVDALLTLGHHYSLVDLMTKAQMPEQVNDEERINRFLSQLNAN